ncbi:MAG TPA: glycosyltransferase family 4 protein [Gemmatimonadales bacterium]|nr:glycosyltransferase family 4 protein [Gemmatimonadales bacterium]
MHTTTDDVLPYPSVGVLHLTISFAPGGRRDAIVTLAAASRPFGIRPHLATLRGDPADSTPFRHNFDSDQSLEIEGRPSLRQLLDLRRHCVAQGIRIVHAHDASSQFVASMLRIVAPSLHVVMTFHRSLGFESAGWRNRLRNAATLTLVDRVLTASGERREHFIAENRIPGRKVTTIPLGIDLERFRPDALARAQVRAEFGVGPDELLIVSAGHYGPEKGLDIAVTAVGLSRDTLSQRGFVVRHLHMGTGDPDRIAWMKARVEEAGDATTLIGQRPDPERILAAADLLLHTPRLEAFGLVLVQAMAVGLPVVASSVGGIPEIVAAGVGDLVPAGDPRATAEQLDALLADPGRRRAMAAAAVQRAHAEYGAATFARRHRELYDTLWP